MGANLPAEEIAAASVMLGPQLVALSITCSSDDRIMVAELNRLVALLDHRYPMIIGGRAGYELRHHADISRKAIWAETDELIGILNSPATLPVAPSPCENAPNS